MKYYIGIQLTLIGLRLVGVIKWSWLIVLLPTWLVCFGMYMVLWLILALCCVDTER